MEWANGLKESEESLVVGFSRVIREKAVSGSIRQLSISVSKIIIFVEDHSGTALVCQEDVGFGPEGAESLALSSSLIKISRLPLYFLESSMFIHYQLARPDITSSSLLLAILSEFSVGLHMAVARTKSSLYFIPPSILLLRYSITILSA